MLFGRIVSSSCLLAAGALLWGCSAQKMPSPPVTGTVIPGAAAAVQGTGGAGSALADTSAANTGLAPGQQPMVAPDAGGAPQMNGLAGAGGGPVDMGEPPDDMPLADAGAAGPGDAAVPPADAGNPADAGDAGGFGGFGGEPDDDGP